MTRDLTESLAILLSSRRAREVFKRDPYQCAKELKVDSESLASFVSLPAIEVSRQGEGLIKKRFHEVRKHLPGFLKKRPDLFPLFAEYAEGYWPKGHRRHEIDCRRFLWWCLRRVLRLGLTRVQNSSVASS